jgi:hypothetical protein
MGIGVLVVEENEHEATLLTSAVLVHDAMINVRTVPSVAAALDYLREAAPPQAPRLVILGARALGAPEFLARLNGLRPRHAIVAIVPDLSAVARERALAAGVQAVHPRPSTWEGYRDLVHEIVVRWQSSR